MVKNRKMITNGQEVCEQLGATAAVFRILEVKKKVKDKIES